LSGRPPLGWALILRIIISDERHEFLGTGGGVKAFSECGDTRFSRVDSDTILIDGVRPNLGRRAAAFDPQQMEALLRLIIENLTTRANGPICRLGPLALSHKLRLEK
jgi:hypothetical protein